MFFVLRDHMQLEVPRLVAAGVVSFAWVLLAALVAFVAMCFRRMISKT
jgi:amino acid transporter